MDGKKGNMLKKIGLLGLLIFTQISCEFVLDKKDDVLSLQTKEITYDDYTYETDNLNQIVYLDNNRQRMNGHYIVMYNENISEEFKVTSGLLNGFLKTYYPEGAISKEKNYKNGKLHGESIFYTKEGSIYNRATYKNGKLVGDDIRYDEKGEIISKRKFVEGIEYQHMFKDGKMVASEFKKNIDGTVYDLIVKYDAFENISLVLGQRDYLDNSKIFYVFDRNFKLIEAVDSEKEPSKVAYYFGLLK